MTTGEIFLYLSRMKYLCNNLKTVYTNHGNRPSKTFIYFQVKIARRPEGPLSNCHLINQLGG